MQGWEELSTSAGPRKAEARWGSRDYISRSQAPGVAAAGLAVQLQAQCYIQDWQAEEGGRLSTPPLSLQVPGSDENENMTNSFMELGQVGAGHPGMSSTCTGTKT